MAFTGAKSNTYEDALLDYIFRGQTSPATGADLYIGIFTGGIAGDITSPDGGDTTNLYQYEPTGGTFGGYQRIQVSTVFGSTASAGSITNNQLIDFGTSTGATAWGAVTGFFVGSKADGAVGSETDILYYGIFDTPKSVTSGDSVRITNGNLTISES